MRATAEIQQYTRQVKGRQNYNKSSYLRFVTVNTKYINMLLSFIHLWFSLSLSLLFSSSLLLDEDSTASAAAKAVRSSVMTPGQSRETRDYGVEEPDFLLDHKVTDSSNHHLVAEHRSDKINKNIFTHLTWFYRNNLNWLIIWFHTNLARQEYQSMKMFISRNYIDKSYQCLREMTLTKEPYCSDYKVQIKSPWMFCCKLRLLDEIKGKIFFLFFVEHPTSCAYCARPPCVLCCVWNGILSTVEDYIWGSLRVDTVEDLIRSL